MPINLLQENIHNDFLILSFFFLFLNLQLSLRQCEDGIFSAPDAHHAEDLNIEETFTIFKISMDMK